VAIARISVRCSVESVQVARPIPAAFPPHPSLNSLLCLLGDGFCPLPIARRASLEPRMPVLAAVHVPPMSAIKRLSKRPPD
jgi:hypothetical protein